MRSLDEAASADERGRQVDEGTLHSRGLDVAIARPFCNAGTNWDAVDVSLSGWVCGAMAQRRRGILCGLDEVAAGDKSRRGDELGMDWTGRCRAG